MWPDLRHFDVVLVVSIGVGFAAILLATWRDSWRLLCEFLAPLKPRRPRFRLIYLFAFTAVASVLVKIATIWPWAKFDWLDNLGVFATITLGFSLASCVVYLFVVDMFPHRYKPLNREIVPPSAHESPQENRGSTPKGIRFPEKKRPTSRFKW